MKEQFKIKSHTVDKISNKEEASVRLSFESLKKYIAGFCPEFENFKVTYVAVVGSR